MQWQIKNKYEIKLKTNSFVLRFEGKQFISSKNKTTITWFILNKNDIK